MLQAVQSAMFFIPPKVGKWVFGRISIGQDLVSRGVNELDSCQDGKRNLIFKLGACDLDQLSEMVMC